VNEALQKLQTQLESLREELAQWKRAAMFRRQVDLIDFGAIRGFVYTDDLCYRQIDDRFKHGHIRKATPAPPHKTYSIAEAYERDDVPLLELLFCHYWLHGLDFALFDVGCQYGFGAMTAAQLIQSHGKDNRVFAFDPGVAAELTPFNLALSGLLDRVTFERLAISDAPRVAAVFTELGHSENNRIVNRTPGQEAISYPVMATSLDEYVRTRGVREHLIVKVDTQGAEAEVLAGMQRLLQDRFATIITEFTPWALSTHVDPADWLRTAMRQFAVFDLGTLDPLIGSGHRAQALDAGELPAFVKSVDSRPCRYTDLLLIPIGLPGADALMWRVNSSMCVSMSNA